MNALERQYPAQLYPAMAGSMQLLPEILEGLQGGTGATTERAGECVVDAYFPSSIQYACEQHAGAPVATSPRGQLHMVVFNEPGQVMNKT